MSRMQREGTAQHELIIAEAKRRGIECTEVEMTGHVRSTSLTFGEREELIVQGIPQAWINDKATRYCDYKQLTKDLFASLGIPFPQSFRFTHPADIDPGILNGKRIFICKPEVGTNGKGVAFDIRTTDDLLNYHRTVPPGTVSLLEEYVQGHDLRIQVIGGRIVAACIRHPAFVRGNGSDTLESLIRVRQEEIFRQNPSNELTIDTHTLQLIVQAGYTLDSIIPDEIDVPLKRIANIGQGGVAEDCTDRISSGLQEWVNALCEGLGTSYFALDIITKDIRDLKSYVALELNLRAEWMHHTFSEGRTHDLAAVVLDELMGGK